MDISKQRLVSQLQQLQQQITELRQAYLAQSKPIAKEVSPKEVTPKPVASTPDNEKLTKKDQKLLELTIRSGKENELYKTVSNTLKALFNSGKTTFSVSDLEEIQKAMNKIRNKTDNWEIFKQKFSTVHKDFFDKLKAAHPEITKTELKFCAYLRIHMTSKQIASAMDISMEAIRKNRYRIRKKLGLKTEESLEEYIDRF